MLKSDDFGGETPMSATTPDPFVRMPLWWIEQPGLDAPKLGLLAVLASYARQDKPTCFPSQSTLAERVGRSRAWVNAALADLCDIGIIEKRSRFRADQGRTSSLYTIRFHQGQEVAKPASHDQISVPNHVSEELTGGVKDGDMKQIKDKSTHSEGSIDEWKPQPELLREMEKKIGLEAAKHYVQRFILRCKQQYHYRLEELDLALSQWFQQDEERLVEKRAKAAAAGSQPKKRGWSKQPGPLLIRPDDRVALRAEARPAEIDLPDDIWAAAVSVERGERLPDDMPDQIRFRAALASLLSSKGRNAYDQWLAHLDFAGVSDGHAVVRASSSWKASYVREKFRSDITEALHKAGLRFEGLSVVA